MSPGSNSPRPNSPRPNNPVPYAEFREIFAELALGAGDRDLSGEHPDELIATLAEAGFGKLRVPVEYGGFDVDLPTLFALLAEAGEADSNVPQIWRGHFTTTEILRRESDHRVRDRWFTEIGSGAVFGNAQSEPSTPNATTTAGTTRAHTENGREVVSGIKFYSTGARFADYIRAAVVDDAGRRGFVVIPARHTGVEHIDDWNGVGQRQTGSGTTVLRSVPVERSGQIGRDPQSLRGLDSFVQIVHLANLTGIARSLVGETVDIVRRRTRTSRHALTQEARVDPDILAVVGRLQARRLTAETLLAHTAQRLEDAHRDGEEDGYAQTYVETSTAQIAVIEAVLDAATAAFDAGGSSTVRTGVHLDRHWRNARTLASHNPIVYKPRVVGDYLVNDVLPVSGYYSDPAGRGIRPGRERRTAS